MSHSIYRWPCELMAASGLLVLVEGSEQRAQAIGTLSLPGMQTFRGTEGQQNHPSARSEG